MSMSFMECKACDEKPGSPPLCEACLNNRSLISHQTTYIKRLENAIKAAEAVFAMLRDK